MAHQDLINRMQERGIPVSPFMHYWTLVELIRYFIAHSPQSLEPT